MRKPVLIAGAIVLAVGLLALGLLSTYKVDLVHYAVEQAVLQKAAAETPRREIETRFAEAYRKHSGSGRGRHLQHLLEISQRIEKLPKIDSQEMQWVFEKLESP